MSGGGQAATRARQQILRGLEQFDPSGEFGRRLGGLLGVNNPQQGGGGLLGNNPAPTQQIPPGMPGGQVPKGVRYRPDGTPELYY